MVGETVHMTYYDFRRKHRPGTNRQGRVNSDYVKEGAGVVTDRHDPGRRCQRGGCGRMLEALSSFATPTRTTRRRQKLSGGELAAAIPAAQARMQHQKCLAFFLARLSDHRP